jgi:iron complex outermembrane recepter protein
MLQPRAAIPLALSLAVYTTLHAEETTPAQRLATPASETTLGAMVSTGRLPAPYGPPPVTTITGLPSPIRELPLTVNTVTEQFLKDSSVRRTRDLVGYVPGVYSTEQLGGTGDNLNIRGFDFLFQTYVNGMRNRAVTDASKGFGNIDRIEFFKGPGGVEFGAGDPGGFVNYVTKKPQNTSSITLGTEIGSYEYFGGYLDATGPLWTPALPPPSGKDGKESKEAKAVEEAPSDLGLFYRFITTAESANSFRDTFDSDRVLVAPSLLWNYAEDSSVLLEFEYSHRDQPVDRGIIYLEGVGFSGNFAPINLSYHEPDDFIDSNNTRTSLYWNHKLNDTFKLKLTAEANTSNVTGVSVTNPATFLLYGVGNQWNGTRLIPRSTQNLNRATSSYAIKPEVLATFDTGPVKHTGLAGFSYAISRQDLDSSQGFDDRSIDFENPVYGRKPVKLPAADPSDPDSIPSTARLFHSDGELEEYGVYYQHKMDFFDRIHLLGGVRYEWYENDFGFTTNTRTLKFPPVEGFLDQNFSWRAGAVVDITKQWSVFAGYSNSFQPQEGVLSGGGFPDALEATSFEFGVKASLLDDRLHATLSVFETERKNLLESDPNDPTFTFVVPIGTVKVRGIELEVAGDITDDLNIYGGFALLESEITDTLDLFTKGREFYNVPNVQVGVRLRYDTSRWLIPGLSFGAGVIYVGDRAGDATNSFTLPDYWRFDAGIYYAWRNWRFKVTCENVGDERHFIASQGFPDLIQPGAPRLYTFGAEVKF